MEKHSHIFDNSSLTAKQDIYSLKLAITNLDKKPWYHMEEPDANDNDIDPYKFRCTDTRSPGKSLILEFIKEDAEWVYLKAETPDTKERYYALLTVVVLLAVIPAL